MHEVKIVVALGFVACFCYGHPPIPARRCPPDNELHPCRCNPFGFFGLVCDNVTSAEGLKSTLEKASDSNIVEVTVQFSTMDYLPLQRLNFLGYVFLNLRSVSLTKFCEDALYGRIRLEQLHLDNVKTGIPLPWEKLSSLMDMKRFLVANMRLETVEDVIQHLPSSLQSFSIISTKTENLPRRAFAKFLDLVYICVNKTDIVYLARSMFPEVSNIRYFYFGNNRIETLPEDLFTNMPHLQRVGLEGNLLRQIKQTTFAPVWHQLTVLFLEGNPIKCRCEVVWITEWTTPPILTGSCQSPKAKYGKAIKHLNKTDFLC